MDWAENQTLPDQWQAARSKNYLAYIQLYIITASEMTNAGVVTMEQFMRELKCAAGAVTCRLY